MIYSMTGYGQATGTHNGKTIKVELKTLNGKTTDLRIKIPPNLKEKDIEIRNQILTGVNRGKIEAQINFESELGEEVYTINKILFKQYYEELSSLSQELGIKDENIIQSIMRIQGVLVSKEEQLNEDEWNVVKTVITEAISSLNQFRETEGAAMHSDLLKNVMSIMNHLNGVDPYEVGRIEQLKERIRKNLQQYLKDENADQNRYEQEILYYLEKLDISEEKVRLKQHCKYFEDIMKSEDLAKGKKLAFVSQEMGREINTLGSKAQEHNIQQIVVMMKDDLERIKEMIANVL